MQLKRMGNSKLFLSISLFFFFIQFASSSSYSSNNSHICPVIQSHALLRFKQNLFSTDPSYKEGSVGSYCHELIGSHYYPIMKNWKTSIDCCNWDGVTCNRFTGDVIALDLSCGMLRGIIHFNTTLFNLPHLSRLNLAYNDLYRSQLPNEIGRFNNSLTHLNISQCRFTGQVPKDITLLRKLVSLDLSSNMLDFTLEPHVFYNLLQNSTHLRDLSLVDVSISSILPTYLNISPSLKLLYLGSTGLQGKLPVNIFNLQYLEKLDLSRNNLTLGRLSKVNMSTSNPLKFLGLQGMRLSSREISNSIGHLKSLNYLDLSTTNLLGEMPHSIGHLESLNTLVLVSCGLMGPLPKFLVNLRYLTRLYLYANMFNGTLPSWLFTLPLETIYLGNNMFSGSLPSELFTMKSLKRLSLGYNQFDGVIDVLDQGSTLQTFRQLVNLTYLELAHNNFSGEWELDALLSSLKTLVSLDLSYSGLTVTTNNVNHYVNPDFRMLYLSSCKLKVFPESLQAMKNLEYLDLSRNEIHGHVPDWVGEIGGNKLSYLDLSYNFITSLPKFQWDLHYLYLRSNLIQGSFPLSICNMSNIWHLEMSNNSFGGVIPQCFGNISSSLVRIGLANNYFHGTIPNLYKGCGELQQLLLNENQFEGEVPSSLSECHSLMQLDMHSNKIQGPFPPSICNMSNLQYLRLSDNRFGGVIPQCFENIFSNPYLRMVDLGDNYFHGTIPNAYKNCGYLEGLILNGNQVDGEVPSSLFKCQFLKVLDLGNNHLNGTFPGWLGDLPLLQVLDLKSNNFHGPIETSSTVRNPFPSLQVLDLSHNGFVGQLPRKYFQSLDAMKNVVKSHKNLEYLVVGGYYYSIVVAVKGVQLDFPQISVDYTIVDLSDNRFEGQIPDIIGNLSSLIVLNLSHNNLTGRIPHALGNLSEIESLDLSWNQLTKEIPQSLTALTFLAFLNLSQNHLVGRIPEGRQFNTFEANSFGGNPKLCGLPLPEKCEHPHLPQLEEDEEIESGFTWRVVMLGYGCGTLLGLVMGYLMLWTGRPKWFNAIADAGEDMIQSRRKKRRYIFIGK